MKKINFSVIAILLLFMACKNKEDKFIGTWTLKRDKSTTLTIVKTDKGLIIEYRNLQFPLSYDKVNDVLLYNDGSENIDISFDKKHDGIKEQGNLWVKQ